MDTELDDFRALQYDPQKNQFRLCRLKHQPLKDEDVLVRVAYAGLCATDFLIISNDLPCTLRPITLGHEISGTVHKMGYLVKNVALGDSVVINPRSDSYCCARCGQICSCVGKRISVGMYMDGGFAEYCLVPSYMVHSLSKHTILKEAVLCSALCDVLHALKQAAPVSLSERILVIGAGIHGFLLSIILHSEGYRNVTITECNSERRVIVYKLVPGFRVISPMQLLKLRNNGIWRPDLAIDCSGNPAAVLDALSCLDQGGRMILNRCSVDDQKLQISPFQLISREIKIIGSLTNSASFPEVLKVLDVIGEKYIDYEQWGIKLYELDDYEQAFLDLEEETAIKVVFKVDKDLEDQRLSHPASETLSDVIRMDLQQLLKAIPGTPHFLRYGEPVETYDPLTTIKESYIAALLKRLGDKASFIFEADIPEDLERLESNESVLRVVEELKSKK